MNSYEIKRDKKQKKSVKMSMFASSKGENYKQTSKMFVYFFLGALITKTPSELKLEVI